VFIHPSSVNHKKRDEDGTTQTLQEKQLIAFAEKRQNVSTGSTNPQKFIVTTTRLDPVAYILFGAYEITVTDRGLECDDWLPIVGNIDALDDIQRLKYLMEASLQRVFEGITYQRHRQRSRRDMIPIAREEEREDEADDDDDVSQKDRSLSPQEIKDLDLMTTDIVRVLNHAADERIAGQSRQNSRPASPMGSPLFGSNRLAGTGGSGSGSRSGTSTPYGRSGMNSAFNSRPGTPGVGPSPLRKW
jgi:small subunit ribosomal protein S24e